MRQDSLPTWRKQSVWKRAIRNPWRPFADKEEDASLAAYLERDRLFDRPSRRLPRPEKRRKARRKTIWRGLSQVRAAADTLRLLHDGLG